MKNSDYGIAWADCPLADEIVEGQYVIACTVGDTPSRLAVQVQKYVLPKFKLGVTLDKPYYKPGQMVTATVDGHYFFGKPVAGLVQLEARTEAGQGPLFQAGARRTRTAAPSSPSPCRTRARRPAARPQRPAAEGAGHGHRQRRPEADDDGVQRRDGNPPETGGHSRGRTTGAGRAKHDLLFRHFRRRTADQGRVIHPRRVAAPSHRRDGPRFVLDHAGRGRARLDGHGDGRRVRHTSSGSPHPRRRRRVPPPHRPGDLRRRRHHDRLRPRQRRGAHFRGPPQGRPDAAYGHHPLGAGELRSTCPRNCPASFSSTPTAWISAASRSARRGRSTSGRRAACKSRRPPTRPNTARGTRRG